MTESQLQKHADYWQCRFSAMASPCEVLVETDDRTQAEELLHIVMTEAHRIEQKFSRYRSDNIVYQINSNRGNPINVDPETAQLLNFAQQLFELSDGLFDITSGVLREAWHFDGSDHVPDPEKIALLLNRVGWDKVSWTGESLTMLDKMQIDFGGIGKEYAVDRAVLLIKQHSPLPCLVNFGGDLAITETRKNDKVWQIGIESVNQLNKSSEHVLELKRGALATSGDVRRFLLKDGVRYGHILNPKTGWPIQNAPRSVTVAAGTCTEAGMLSTLGMLQGKSCESFLTEEKIQFWCMR